MILYTSLANLKDGEARHWELDNDYAILKFFSNYIKIKQKRQFVDDQM